MTEELGDDVHHRRALHLDPLIAGVLEAVDRWLADWRAFCARYFPGRRRRYDLEAVVAYGAFAAALMRKPRLEP